MSLLHIYDFPEDAPNYPLDFYEVQGGTQKLKVRNSFLRAELRAIEAGEWCKVYQDGRSGGSQFQFTILRVRRVECLI